MEDELLLRGGCGVEKAKRGKNMFSSVCVCLFILHCSVAKSILNLFNFICLLDLSIQTHVGCDVC